MTGVVAFDFSSAFAVVFEAETTAATVGPAATSAPATEATPPLGTVCDEDEVEVAAVGVALLMLPSTTELVISRSLLALDWKGFTCAAFTAGDDWSCCELGDDVGRAFTLADARGGYC